MAATFNPALTSATDRIRQRIGDTDVAKALVQDETISAYLATGMSELATARRLCLDIAARFAGVGDVTLDDQMQRTGQIYQHYIDLAREIGLEEKAATGAGTVGAAVIVGGVGDCRGPLSSDCCWP